MVPYRCRRPSDLHDAKSQTRTFGRDSKGFDQRGAVFSTCPRFILRYFSHSELSLGFEKNEFNNNILVCIKRRSVTEVKLDHGRIRATGNLVIKESLTDILLVQLDT